VSSPDDDLEALGQLASGRRLDAGKGESKRRQPVKPVRSGVPVESLDDIVSGLAQGRSAPASRPAGQDSFKAPEPLESLEQLLPARSAEPRQTQPTRRTSAAAVPADAESLESLVFPAATGKTQPSFQSPVPERVVRKPIDPPIEELETLQPAAAEPVSPSRFQLPLGRIMLAVLLVVGVAFTIYQHPPGKVSYPSPLAAVVAQLAVSVDAHYAKQGSLPATLTQLEGFPKDAVEWPIERYGVRLLERRMEFFFSGASGYEYVIIGRQGEEAWAFAKGLQPELQQVPAH
jgi:hypothetical protein